MGLEDRDYMRDRARKRAGGRSARSGTGRPTSTWLWVTAAALIALLVWSFVR